MKKRWLFLFFVLGLILLMVLLVNLLGIKNVQNQSKNTPEKPIVVRKLEKSSSPVPSSVSAKRWTLLLTGDVIPSRVVNKIMSEKKDFFWPLEEIAPILRDADLTLINLESPLIADCLVVDEGFKFCGAAEFAKSLGDAGVDIANLANNHSLNYGWDGLAETQRLLKNASITTTGFTGLVPQYIPHDAFFCLKDPQCSVLITKNVQGIRVGFLGYNAVGQDLDRARAVEQIRVADGLVDVLIVSIHWGKEYERKPQADLSLAPDDPKELGHLFIDSGADLVVGNHPHVYQEIEEYQGKLIFYALGNTIFDQEWSLDTKRGILAKLTFEEKNLIDHEIIPIGIKQFGRAYVLGGSEKEEVLEFYGKSEVRSEK